MSNRYWVAGAGNWNGTTTTHWSTTSGGTGGASAPTSSDDVFLDANSGSVTVTCTVNPVCRNLDCTGFTGTLTGSSDNLKIYGNMTLGSGMTSTMTSQFEFSATDTGHTITTNGVSLINIPRFYGLGGGWTLQDDLTTTNDVDIYFGTLNTNGKTVSCNNLYSDNTTVGGLILGSSTIILKSYLSIDLTNVNFNFNSGTSTIKIIMNSDVSNCIFANQGSGTYYNLWISTSGIYAKADFQGNYSFNNIKIEANRSLWIRNTYTVNYATLTVNGYTNNLVTISSPFTGSGILNNTTGIPVTIDYVNISKITATGQTLIAGRHSIDGGGNTNVTFISPTVSPFPSFYQ